MSEQSPLDHAVFDDLFDYIGADAARSVVDLFLGESRGYLARIEAVLSNPDGRDGARRAAHSLKSSSGQLGATALATAAEAVEQAAAKSDVALTDLISELRGALSKTETAIAEALSRRG